MAQRPRMNRIHLQTGIRNLINDSKDFLTARTATSPRAAGDAIEGIIGGGLAGLLGPFCIDYRGTFPRRAMEDIAFTGGDGKYYVVDVKTHRNDTRFNMPNLISVERLARFYENDDKVFIVLLISYGVSGNRATVTAVTFVPIEFLHWDCLRIGALGWGQIQLANANAVTIRDGYLRKHWMLELCDAMLAFYPGEIAKTRRRVDRFRQVQTFWQQRRDR